MKFKSLIAGAFAFGLLSSTAFADNLDIDLTPGFAATGMFSSDLVQHGLSQTNGHAVGLATGSYTHSSGLYVTGTVNNNSTAPSNVETAPGVGFNTKLGSFLNGDILYDVGVDYHYFPNSVSGSNVNYAEFHNTLNYVKPWGRLIANASFQPRGQYNYGFTYYLDAGADVNLPYGVVGSGRVGVATFENHYANGLPNYQYWSIGASRDMYKELAGHHATLFITYSGASVDKSTPAVGDTGGQRVLGGVSYSF
jgi:uncharacterized protein (TIGR02001 family)